MQREIKFKAWDMLRQKMCSVDSIEFVDFIEGRTGINVYTIENKIKDSRWIADGNFKLIQYTGRKDSKGVEIYENDWCSAEFRDRNGIIVIQGRIIMDDFMWCIDCTGSIGYEIFSINRPHNFKVIGNVFENPELINQVK